MTEFKKIATYINWSVEAEKNNLDWEGFVEMYDEIRERGYQAETNTRRIYLLARP